MKTMLITSLLGTNLNYYFWGSLIFLVIYFALIAKFVNKKLKIKAKLFLYTFPFTLLLVAYLSMFFSASINALYSSLYTNNIGAITGILNNAVANYNPSTVQGQIGDVFNSAVANINAFGFSNGILWFVLALVIYFLCITMVFIIVLKPLKSIQKNLTVLASHGEIKNFNLKGKEFSDISSNIMQIQNNFQSIKNELARLNSDYNKVLPKQAIQMLGKKDISELSAGNYVQKHAYIMNIYFNFKDETEALPNLIKVNKYINLISPILRNFNGVIISYSTTNTQCLFGNNISITKAMEALNNINFNNPEINIVPEEKNITIAVVGYSKQFTVQILP